MLTDVILLDFFNTFGMPTSTMVSIVFELLGSAIAMSVVMVMKNEQDFAEISNRVTHIVLKELYVNILYHILLVK